MSDLPTKIFIQEEGPREGFQIAPNPISTEDKVRFIEALADTGVHHIQCVSFVNPKRVPGMADAEQVARQIKRKDGVAYTGLWLNLQGFERALKSNLDIYGSMQISASETFSIKNTGRNTEQTLQEQRRLLDLYRQRNVQVETAIVMTAFGCNFEGEIKPERVRDCVAMLTDVAAEFDIKFKRMRLADTVGWANPNSIAAVVGVLRERWPDLPLTLHLHDTRGAAIANALMGLQMGVDSFDSSCAGLGGCPFAGHKGAAGNICTEDLVFMCQEMGIDTGIDLDALIEAARMAETIVGHSLPGKIMHAGSLRQFRK